MIFTGKSADGSDAYPALGMFVSPDGKQWSNQPFTKEDKMWAQIYNHLASNLRSLRMEYDLILNKQSTLSRRHRDYIVYLMTHEEVTNDN
jgi:hypothetical protein